MRNTFITIGLVILSLGSFFFSGCASKSLQSDLIGIDGNHRRIPQAVTMGNRKDPRAIKPLIVLLSDHNSHFREEAAEALGRIGMSAVPALIVALHSNDSETRGYAAKALGFIGPEAKAAIPILINVFPLFPEIERKLITENIFKTEVYIPELGISIPATATKTDYSKVKIPIAVVALEKITGEKVGLEKNDWLNWWEKNRLKYQK